MSDATEPPSFYRRTEGWADEQGRYRTDAKPSATMTIVEFLTARLDKDRELIRQLIQADVSGRWTERRGEVYAQMTVSLVRIAEIDGVNLGPVGEQLVAEHIARFDPSRMLDEIEAKRAIIRQHTAESHECPDGFLDAAETEAHCGWARECPTLRLLASVYSDHPDYDQAWKL